LGNFLGALSRARDIAGLKRGSGLRVLTATVTSPTLAFQIQEFLTAYPEAKWHQYEPCGRHSARAGAMIAFGKPVNTIYRFDRADVIVSLDADFLGPGMPGGLRYARDYTGRRRSAAADPNVLPPRLYVAEGTPSITGGMAEHRFRMRTGEVEAFAAKLMLEPTGAVVNDLNAHRGAGIVIAGEYQPARVHAVAHALNQAFGNSGKTGVYTDPVESNPVDQLASLSDLVTDMRSGAVETLLILGTNPVYDAPADLNFLDAMKQVKLRAHLGLYANETAAWCHWHVPEAHYLESWSDGRAYDGTVSLVQPLIAPIYGGKTAHEVLNVLNNQADRSAHDTVRDYWKTQHQGADFHSDFDDFWQTSLHDGVVDGTALPQIHPPAAKVPNGETNVAPGLEIVFRPDPAIGDGAMSNNAWLQEMPKPQNKMTWENAVWFSPKSAQHYGVATGDVIELSLGGRKVEGPVWIMPGHADESITIHFGYGRTRAGKVADGAGFNAYAIRNSTAPWMAGGVEITRKSRGHIFATTQHTQTMEERDPFRVAIFAGYHNRPQFARPPEDRVPDTHTMFPLWDYSQGHKWGMSIDLTSCIGCQACTSSVRLTSDAAAASHSRLGA
jgi:hypothetical protein